MEYKEIFELKRMLENADIPFEMKEHFDGYVIFYPRFGQIGKGCTCSVIEHEYSYGHDEDRLEIMGLLTEEEKKQDEVAGYLTATNVFIRIKNHYKGVK